MTLSGPPRPSRPGICLVCGFASGLIEASMVEWLRPADPAKRFAQIDRCVDRPACRARVHEAGKLWPFDDGTPAPDAGKKREVPAWL